MNKATTTTQHHHHYAMLLTRLCVCVCVLWLTNVYMRATQPAQLNAVAQHNGMANTGTMIYGTVSMYARCFKFHFIYDKTHSPKHSIKCSVSHSVVCVRGLLPFVVAIYSFVHYWTTRISYAIYASVCVKMIHSFFYLFLSMRHTVHLFIWPLVHQKSFLLAVCVCVAVFAILLSMLIMKISCHQIHDR